jgi:hypothetical protein
MTYEWLAELRFRRSAALLQQSDTLHMMRHRENADGIERERERLRSTAFMRRN